MDGFQLPRSWQIAVTAVELAARPRVTRTAWCGLTRLGAIWYQPTEVEVARHPVLGHLVWAVLFGTLFGVGGGPGPSSIPERGGADAERHLPGDHALSGGAVALFALWLWFGWHIFIQGWHFLLRA